MVESIIVETVPIELIEPAMRREPDYREGAMTAGWPDYALRLSAMLDRKPRSLPEYDDALNMLADSARSRQRIESPVRVSSPS